MAFDVRQKLLIMNTDLSAIFQKHLDTCYEIERRDVVFRRDLSGEERRIKAPWIMAGRSALADEEEAVWRRLGDQSIDPNEALREITLLMESYYGKPYPL
jgi:hypothetical protein